MNILLFDPHLLADNGNLRVSGRQHRHLTEVLRAKLGDSIRVGAIDGDTGVAEVVTIAGDSSLLRVALHNKPPPPLPMTVILALPRPKMMRRVMQTLASLGVKKIHLINSYRVEKSFWQSPWLDPGAIREQLLAGLEQAGDTLLPEVCLHKRFKPFAEDTLPGIVAGTRAIVAHPRAAIACPRDPAGPLSLALGPEGGFIDYEVDKLAGCGFQAVSLGPRILRVETAIPVLISRLFPVI